VLMHPYLYPPDLQVRRCCVSQKDGFRYFRFCSVGSQLGDVNHMCSLLDNGIHPMEEESLEVGALISLRIDSNLDAFFIASVTF
jgi:hypothetical protein